MNEHERLQKEAADWRNVAHQIAQELACYTDSIDDPTGFADNVYLLVKEKNRGRYSTSDRTSATLVSNEEQQAKYEQLEIAMTTERYDSQDWHDAVEQQDA